MAKQKVCALKSYYEGHVKLRVSASANNRGQDISATVTVDLTVDAARALLAQLDTEIIKTEDKAKAKAASDAGRKAWRAREMAAGRMRPQPQSKAGG